MKHPMKFNVNAQYGRRCSSLLEIKSDFYKVQHVGTESPRPQITRDGALMSHQGVVDELNAMRVALVSVHQLLLENGTVPLGLIEDVLNGAYVNEQANIAPTGRT